MQAMAHSFTIIETLNIVNTLVDGDNYSVYSDVF